MDTSCWIPWGIVAVSTVAAAVTDLRSYRIPNWLTFSLLVSGVVYHAVVGGFGGLRNSLLGVSFGFGVLVVLYLLGAMGGGDVKLLAGVGAWLGMPMTAYVFLVAAVAGATYSLVLLVWQGRLALAFTTIWVTLCQLGTLGKHLGADERVESFVQRPDRRKRVVPFALMVALGVILVLVWSQWA